jgi:repressor of nif and glnA expression
MKDNISLVTLRIIDESNDVLETKEIQEKVQNSIKNITRTKLFSRLNNLRGEGLIKGKFVGPGKGVWIWWKASAFLENKGEKNAK